MGFVGYVLAVVALFSLSNTMKKVEALDQRIATLEAIQEFEAKKKHTALPVPHCIIQKVPCLP